MLLKVAKMNNKKLTFCKSRHFFSKNFQMTKFCERAHEDKKFENKSYKW